MAGFKYFGLSKIEIAKMVKLYKNGSGRHQSGQFELYS